MKSKSIVIYGNCIGAADTVRPWIDACVILTDPLIQTPSTISTFILAMATNPTVQKKAQEEIDRVIGDSNRLPDFLDRSNMPYVEAILHEVLRYGLVLPLSLPHLSTTDDVYNGFLIPKGTLLISNIWCDYGFPCNGSVRDAYYIIGP